MGEMAELVSEGDERCDGVVYYGCYFYAWGILFLLAILFVALEEERAEIEGGRYAESFSH